MATILSMEWIRSGHKRQVAYIPLAIILAEWLVLLGCVAVFSRFPNPWLYPVLWFIAGTRFYALYSLLHEAIHFHIHPSKKWNDAIARIFLCFPLFVNLKKMRSAHWAHHKYLGSPKDPEQSHLDYPEFRFPISRKKLIDISVADLLGIHFLRYRFYVLSKWLRVPSSDIFTIKNALYLVLFFLAYFLDFWKELLFLWIIPYATVYQWLNRMRLYSEHFNLPNETREETRSLDLPFFQKIFFAPHGIGYHAAHHKHPDVPFYLMKSYHKAAFSDSEEYPSGVFEKSYFQMLLNISEK